MCLALSLHPLNTVFFLSVLSFSLEVYFLPYQLQNKKERVCFSYKDVDWFNWINLACI